MMMVWERKGPLSMLKYGRGACAALAATGLLLLQPPPQIRAWRGEQRVSPAKIVRRDDACVGCLPTWAHGMRKPRLVEEAMVGAWGLAEEAMVGVWGLAEGWVSLLLARAKVDRPIHHPEQHLRVADKIRCASGLVALSILFLEVYYYLLIVMLLVDAESGRLILNRLPFRPLLSRPSAPVRPLMLEKFWPCPGCSPEQ